MPMRLHVIPFWLPWLFPKRIWSGRQYSSSGRKRIYLTFDDGPIPEITPWVLQQLGQHQAQATFFCIGENTQRHPEVFQQISEQGHAIGNHTHTHVSDARVPQKAYRKSVTDFAQHTGLKPDLFRPPYGRLKSNNARWLNRMGYRIVMWNFLSYDWDSGVSKEESLAKIIGQIKPGSIIVFHDSLKAESKMKWMLPRVLDYARANGYDCAALE